MKVLLDECVPKRLRVGLIGHEVKTVPEMGWSGIKNGELLKRAQSHFQVMITVDQNVERQQNLERFRLGLIVIAAPNTQLERLRPCTGAILAALDKIKAGNLVKIQA
jgi:hypothetical protein